MENQGVDMKFVNEHGSVTVLEADEIDEIGRDALEVIKGLQANNPEMTCLKQQLVLASAAMAYGCLYGGKYRQSIRDKIVVGCLPVAMAGHLLESIQTIVETIFDGVEKKMNEMN